MTVTNPRIIDWIIRRSNGIAVLNEADMFDIGNWTSYMILLEGTGQAAGIQFDRTRPDTGDYARTHVVCIIDDTLIIDELRDGGRDPIRTVTQIHRIHVDDPDAEAVVADWWEGHIATSAQRDASDAEPSPGLILIDINTGEIITTDRPKTPYMLRVWVD